jgi:hypothetical protein
MKNIHVLPTDKPSRLFEIIQFDLSFDKENYFSEDYKIIHKYKNKHIYITSDEQPKYKDYYTIDGKEIYYCNTLNPTRNNHYKKIILTTDQDLIKYGVQAIDDESLEWFVQNSSCEEVKVELHVGSLRRSDSKNTYKIIIPKEELFKHRVEVLPKEEILENRSNAYEFIDFDKKETLEEAAERNNPVIIRSTPFGSKYEWVPKKERKQFVNGAKWQQEQILDFLYSEITERRDYSASKMCEKVIEFIEQFKNK